MHEDHTVEYFCLSCKATTPHEYLGRSMTGYKICCTECSFTVTLLDPSNIPPEAIKQKGAT